MPTTPKRKQYIDQSARVTNDILAFWDADYPYFASQKLVNVPNQSWRPDNGWSTTYGYYKVLNVPYQVIALDIIN